MHRQPVGKAMTPLTGVTVEISGISSTNFRSRHIEHIKREIEMIEEKYYSSNAAVDRIMARKFRELVRIYVRRQVNRIKGRE